VEMLVDLPIQIVNQIQDLMKERRALSLTLVGSTFVLLNDEIGGLCCSWAVKKSRLVFKIFSAKQKL
jgi:hypothetical protein